MPRGSAFNSVTPDFRGLVPAWLSPLGVSGASSGSLFSFPLHIH